MSRLSRRFYARPTLEVATELLGRKFVHESEEGVASGRIVEVEAYCGEFDPGSHAFRGETPRNSVMFGPPGQLYVYFTYGMHFCCNVVCESDGVAGAVLLRAIEPVDGIDLMKQRRGTEVIRDLARGPARLCQALGIDRRQNGADLTVPPMWIEQRRSVVGEIKSSPRIGLRPGIDQPWRFYEDGPWISRRVRPKS